MNSLKYTAQELEEAQERMLEGLDIQEMETGHLTIVARLATWNSLPVYGRLLMTEEHAVWLDEVLDLVEESEDE